MVQNHDVVMDMTALGIGMSGDEVRAIRGHFLRQFHAGTVNAGYVGLTITAELFWREALRNQKGLIFALCSSAVNPVESPRTPGLGGRCRIYREVRHVCRTLVFFPRVLAPAVSGIDHRTHGVRRPRYLHHAHRDTTANILASVILTMLSTDS